MKWDLTKGDPKYISTKWKVFDGLLSRRFCKPLLKIFTIFNDPFDSFFSQNCQHMSQTKNNNTHMIYQFLPKSYQMHRYLIFRYFKEFRPLGFVWFSRKRRWRKNFWKWVEIRFKWLKTFKSHLENGKCFEMKIRGNIVVVSLSQEGDFRYILPIFAVRGTDLKCRATFLRMNRYQNVFPILAFLRIVIIVRISMEVVTSRYRVQGRG